MLFTNCKKKFKPIHLCMQIFLSLCLLKALLMAIIYVFQLNYSTNENRESYRRKYDIWPEFQVKPINKRYDTKICFGNYPRTVDELIEKLRSLNESKNAICKILSENFNLIFDVKVRYSGQIGIPLELSRHLRQNLIDHFQELNHQKIILISNQFTYEQNAYNPLRSRRPIPYRNESIFDFITNTYSKSKCDLCNYLHMTAEDEFGRNENTHTVRASNAFKIDKWHGMVITRSHHPLNLSITDLKGLFMDGITWANEIYTLDPQYIYTNIGWDTLYKAGASQLHPHIHVLVTPDHYYGSMEQLRAAANSYFKMFNSNYFSKLVDIHVEMDLAEYFGSVVALSMLTGKGDMEVMILGYEPCNDLFTLLYLIIRAYQDHFEQYCYSASMISPAFGKSIRAQYGKVPAIIRIVSRGDCLSQQNDISSFDLFMLSYRSHDPYEVLGAIRKTIEAYKEELLV